MTASADPGVATAAPPARAVWRTYGGGGLIAGGSILLFATVIEWVYYAGGAVDDALLLAYGIAFVVALAVLAASTLPLALGASGRDGVVGTSLLGRVALIGYGSLFLGAQVAQLFGMFAPAVDAAMATSLMLTVLQGIAAVAAAIVIVRAGVVGGVARWSFPISVLAGIVAGAVANAGPSLTAVMIGFCASAASITFVGVTYTLSARRAAAGAMTSPHAAAQREEVGA